MPASSSVSYLFTLVEIAIRNGHDDRVCEYYNICGTKLNRHRGYLRVSINLKFNRAFNRNSGWKNLRDTKRWW